MSVWDDGTALLIFLKTNVPQVQDTANNSKEALEGGAWGRQRTGTGREDRRLVGKRHETPKEKHTLSQIQPRSHAIRLLPQKPAGQDPLAEDGKMPHSTFSTEYFYFHITVIKT